MVNIKLASWNVGSVHENDSEKEVFISAVSQIGADILCLQELPEDNKLFSEIVEAGGFAEYRFHACCVSHVGKHMNMGIAVFSKDAIFEHDVLKLLKPYPKLVSYNGVTEMIHDKYFMAVQTYGIAVITGHGYPSIRYCRPELTYNSAMINDWLKYCIHGKEYAQVFSGIEEWALKISCSKKKIIFAGDFNVDDPLSLMPRIKENHFDVFEGIMTIPDSVYGFEYKTDALIVPYSTQFSEKNLLKVGFDHYAILANLKI